VVLNPEGNKATIDFRGKFIPVETEERLSGLIVHRFPLIYNDSVGERVKLGEGTIYSSTAIVFQKVQVGFIFIIINAIIKTLSLWVIFLWIGHRLLSRPLSVLTSATQQLNLDNVEQLKIDVKTTGQNELKILETAFNSMIQKLLLARKALEASLNSLGQSNARLALLLDSTKEISASSDKFTSMIRATNSILYELAVTDSTIAHLNFQEKEPSGADGYAYFQVQVDSSSDSLPSLKLDTVKNLHHS